MELLTSPEIWMAFVTLTVLEIVLGIDNIIFISVLTDRLPAEQRARARYLGLALAMAMRILLLLSISCIMTLTADLFTIFRAGISGRDLILILGGAFLMYKSTVEVHNSLEGAEEHHGGAAAVSFGGVLLQIAFVDIVFSLDSVITAVGLVKHIEVMIVAIVVSVLVMMALAGTIARFVEEHPTIKMLALSFLLLIGVTLVAEGFDVHVPRGYIYFAMAFSFGVEILNTRARARRAAHLTPPAPVRLRPAQLGDLVAAPERPGA
jgi:predicted tellurium resistance membrane protein TerC